VSEEAGTQALDGASLEGVAVEDYPGIEARTGSVAAGDRVVADDASGAVSRAERRTEGIACEKSPCSGSNPIFHWGRFYQSGTRARLTESRA